MAQNPVICGVSILVCRTRVTLLEDDGSVAAGPNNSYVSDKQVRVQLTPVIEEGQDTVLKGGCDCIVASYKGPNLLKRFDLEVGMSAVEPAMLSLMLGSTIISDTSPVPVPIGTWWAAQVGCDLSPPPNVAFEFWTKTWDGDQQSVSWPHMHHVYPFVNWQIGQQTYEADFSQPTLTGTCRSNDLWGHGPYGDQDDPIPGNAPGGFFYSQDALPAASCGYATVTPGS